jgi:hypothetical protein
MKKLSSLFCVYLWLISFCFSISAQDFRAIRDGIEYAETTRGTKEAPVHINLLRLDLTKVRLDIVHAMDSAIGVEKTSSIATRYGAIAAINAGFFRLDKSIFAGDSAGILQINGKLLSESYGSRIALLIKNWSVTQVSFYHINFSEKVSIGNRDFEISGINRERKDDELIKFTPEFHNTTLTTPNGIEIIIRRNKITQIFDGKGSTEIPKDGFVLSASGKMREQLLQSIRINLKVQITELINTTEPKGYIDVLEAEDIVGGVPQLIRNSKIEITWEREKAAKAFVETRHPRTAVAKLKDGKFLMVTVDGRQEGWSVGMNLNELAAFLLALGATDAMNLDGGGSTTMFLDGKVVNRPSDKEGERSVSDAILVFPRK